jgi:hypothetical protein
MRLWLSWLHVLTLNGPGMALGWPHWDQQFRVLGHESSVGLASRGQSDVFLMQRPYDAGTNRVDRVHHVDLRQRRCVHLEREP